MYSLWTSFCCDRDWSVESYESYDDAAKALAGVGEYDDWHTTTAQGVEHNGVLLSVKELADMEDRGVYLKNEQRAKFERKDQRKSYYRVVVQYPGDGEDAINIFFKYDHALDFVKPFPASRVTIEYVDNTP